MVTQGFPPRRPHQGWGTRRVAAVGQRSVAMTDHGNIYGAVRFFVAAK